MVVKFCRKRFDWRDQCCVSDASCSDVTVMLCHSDNGIGLHYCNGAQKSTAFQIPSDLC